MTRIDWDTPENDWRRDLNENPDPDFPERGGSWEEAPWDADPRDGHVLKERIAARFSNWDPTDRVRLKRLIQTVMDEISPRNLTGSGTGPEHRVSFAQLVFQRLVKRVDSRLTRDEDQRLKQAIKDGLSLEIEGRLIDWLTLEKPLRKLQHKLRKEYLCLCLKYLLDCTYEEISEEMGLSISKIRTHINRGLAFLKRQMS